MAPETVYIQNHNCFQLIITKFKIIDHTLFYDSLNATCKIYYTKFILVKRPLLTFLANWRIVRIVKDLKFDKFDVFAFGLLFRIQKQKYKDKIPTCKTWLHAVANFYAKLKFCIYRHIQISKLSNRNSFSYINAFPAIIFYAVKCCETNNNCLFTHGTNHKNFRNFSFNFEQPRRLVVI